MIDHASKTLMPSLLLVTGDEERAMPGGRALLARLHHQCLASIFGDALAVRFIDTGAPGPRLNGLRGYINGVTPKLIQEIVDRCRHEQIPRVFLDGSNLGILAAGLKHALPEVEVLTFFHNVEARFFLGAFAQRRNLHALGVLLANYVAERSAVRWSDRLIALSARDSQMLGRVYGRRATDILPMAVEDVFTPTPDASAPIAADAPALFVGGAFYANRSGIAWYAREVAPRLPIRTIVIGHGMEAMRGEIERHGNMEVVGAVDRLEPWYRTARVVVAPIFDGSGMKTKVAEALMFGKRVVGTAEAFSGYEAVSSRAGWICADADEFVAAIEAAQRQPLPICDPGLRELYELRYSRQAAEAHLARILRVDLSGTRGGTGLAAKIEGRSS